MEKIFKHSSTKEEKSDRKDRKECKAGFKPVSAVLVVNKGGFDEHPIHQSSHGRGVGKF
jgi:hypothetical protein